MVLGGGHRHCLSHAQRRNFSSTSSSYFFISFVNWNSGPFGEVIDEIKEVMCQKWGPRAFGATSS